MNSLIVVERSATLSHLVVRTLAAAQIQPSKVLASYGEAQLVIGNGASKPAVVILGAPQRMTPEFQDLLVFLKTGAGSAVAVLLMSHESSPVLTEWLSERSHASLLPWANFGRLPAALKQLSPEQGPSRAVSVLNQRSRPLRLLFVDDSQTVRVTYRQMLSEQGFEVDLASNVAEGYAKALTGAYDLMIFDYYMPDGSGDELVSRLKGHPLTAQVPMAIITGTYQDQIIKRCLDAGAVECMFKNEVTELSMARIRALARSVENQKHVDAERQRLAGILASVADGVYGVDEQGTITFLNPAAARLLGYVSDNDLAGRSAHQIFHFAAEDGQPVGESESEISRAYVSGVDLKGFETVFWKRDCTALPVELSVVPLAIGGRRQGSVVVFRDISERKSADRLRWELTHDAMTGLANRRHFMQSLLVEIERRRNSGGYAAVLYIDLDRFGVVEEQIGESAAHQILVDYAQRMTKRLREHDLLARLEDDHFAMVLSGVQLENLFTIADGFRELAHELSIEFQGRRRPLAASVGVAVISRDTPSAEYVLEHARLAAHQAKRCGGDQTQIYVSELDARVARELDAGWTVRLRDALEENRFALLAQPIVALEGIAHEGAFDSRQGWRINATRQTQCFEILCRLVNRDGQWVSPSIFVPLAERVGLMPKIDLWVIEHAIAALAKAPRDRVVFALNLSNSTLQDPESLKAIELAIQTHGIDGQQLVFEVTETMEIGSLHSARKFIQSLRKLGCRFALDDFGTGFSSISHLKHLPVDLLKIEGGFITGLADSEVDQTVVLSITQMAHALGMKVIAECVDTDRSFAWLKESGVDFLQGHYLGEPRRLEEVDFQALTA
jgi:diguanylate cyclase (GGDEF)-like protein/PAS domain S-box-containing protein